MTAHHEPRQRRRLGGHEGVPRCRESAASALCTSNTPRGFHQAYGSSTGGTFPAGWTPGSRGCRLAGRARPTTRVSRLSPWGTGSRSPGRSVRSLPPVATSCLGSIPRSWPTLCTPLTERPQGPRRQVSHTARRWHGCPAPARATAPARRQRRPATAGLPPAPGEHGGGGAANCCCQRLLSCLPGARARGARCSLLPVERLTWMPAPKIYP